MREIRRAGEGFLEGLGLLRESGLQLIGRDYPTATSNAIIEGIGSKLDYFPDEKFEAAFSIGRVKISFKAELLETSSPKIQRPISIVVTRGNESILYAKSAGNKRSTKQIANNPVHQVMTEEDVETLYLVYRTVDKMVDDRQVRPLAVELAEEAIDTFGRKRRKKQNAPNGAYWHYGTVSLLLEMKLTEPNGVEYAGKIFNELFSVKSLYDAKGIPQCYVIEFFRQTDAKFLYGYVINIHENEDDQSGSSKKMNIERMESMDANEPWYYLHYSNAIQASKTRAVIVGDALFNYRDLEKLTQIRMAAQDSILVVKDPISLAAFNKTKNLRAEIERKIRELRELEGQIEQGHTNNAQ